MPPDAARWIPEPTLRVAYRRTSRVSVDDLWSAAQSITLGETGLLGRLVRWRIPGLSAQLCFDELFRAPPFQTLDAGEHHLVSGLVGRIWTLRRDYPTLDSPEAFEAWEAPGTARVVFAQWAQADPDAGSQLCVDARVESLGRQGSIGVAAVRPIVRSFGSLVASEGIAAAVRQAERS